MSGYHGTYVRTVQDLPILGKNVILKITAYEYNCTQAVCVQKTFVDNYDEFLSRYSRMTSRCAEFIRILALSTSCEGAAFISAHMGLKISGDTIIRMLKRLADETPVSKCGDTIGVDDFAYRKGQSYCTVVCDWETRKPIAVLDGRDGESLKRWLAENKHVKKVTRDRAGAYARAISEVLPEAMQIADRFHLYENLLKAVKETIKIELPNQIAIPNAIPELSEETEPGHQDSSATPKQTPVKIGDCGENKKNGRRIQRVVSRRNSPI
jgi:transposase